jgi:hypothetical protein
MPATKLNSVPIDPACGGDRVARLAFLRHGPVAITSNNPLSFLIGETGGRSFLDR